MRGSGMKQLPRIQTETFCLKLFFWEFIGLTSFFCLPDNLR